MLAFVPANRITYVVSTTILSAFVAIFGAFLALIAWRSEMPRRSRILLGGILFGLAVAGMHYLGAKAMTASSLLSFDHRFVIISVVASIALFILGLGRVDDLQNVRSRVELANWMTLAICGLHFTGMAATTIVPLVSEGSTGLLGSTTLAIAVGCVSIFILIASLAATMVEQHLSERAVRELSRMRLMSNLAQEVLLIHHDGIVLEVSKAGERLFKDTADDIIGKPVLGLFAQTSIPALLRLERCALATDDPRKLASKPWMVSSCW